jgi:HlyD family secretion protein
MDSYISVPWWKKKSFKTAAAVAILFISLLLVYAYLASALSEVKVQRSQIGVAPVSQAEFSETLSARATFEPAHSTVVAPSVSGSVAQILIPEGGSVQAGQAILSLMNPDFELNMLKEQGQLTRELSEIDKTNFELNQKLISRRSEVAELAFQADNSRQEFEQVEKLFKKGMASKVAFDKARIKRDFHAKRLQLSKNNLALEEALTKKHIERNRANRQLFQRQLDKLKEKEDSLQVKAKSDGIVTGLDVEVGQSLNAGQPVAKVDSVDAFRLQARLDEYYLDRVQPGMAGEIEMGGQQYPVTVTEVKPSIKDGQFTIVLDLSGQQPAGVRRGQGANLTLDMQNKYPATVMRLADFRQLPRSDWVYVLAQDGQTAHRRTVHFGKKNRDFIVVKGDVKAGDRVLIHYPPDLEAEKIAITGE